MSGPNRYFDRSTGKTGVQDGKDGAPYIYAEGGAGVGQSYNREADSAQITAITTSVDIKFTWVSGSQPTRIFVKPIGGALWVVFDAANDAQADTWLAGQDGEATDSQRFLVPEYLPEETAAASPGSGGAEFSFTAGLGRIDMLEHTSGVTALNVEASG